MVVETTFSAPSDHFFIIFLVCLKENRKALGQTLRKRLACQILPLNVVSESTASSAKLSGLIDPHRVPQ